MFTLGKDTEGRPIVYLRPGQENTFDPEGNVRALIHTIESAIALLDWDKDVDVIKLLSGEKKRTCVSI